MSDEQAAQAVTLGEALIAALRAGAARLDGRVAACWAKAAAVLEAELPALLRGAGSDAPWAQTLRNAWFGPPRFPEDNVDGLEAVWSAGQMAAALADLVSEVAVDESEEDFVAVWNSLAALDDDAERARSWCMAAVAGNVTAWVPDELVVALTG
ncbi:MAG TPA: hypothetical protein VHD87_12650 [Acidimicrobiales bacterium]|nr:hypothetical protein [Acidimicrobiales bacterium]